jgi:Icc-related predicted phosphoesterase
VVTGDMLPLIPAEIFGNRQKVIRWQRKQWLEQAALLWERYHAPIVAVPGNHDRCNYGIPGLCHSIDNEVKHFIVNDLVFTGLRATPYSKGVYDREMRAEEIRKLVNQLHTGAADILLTHYPPEDLPGLREWTEGSDIKLHLHGHDHNTFGTYVDPHSGATISNAATGYQEIKL